MMNVNKRELKKISYDFRSFASRVINANYLEMPSIIAMFIAYIEQTPLLIEYIKNCPLTSSDEDRQRDIKEVAESYGRKMLSTGSTPVEEVAYVFELLKLMRNDTESLVGIGYGYCHSKHYQDMAKAFGNHIVLPFTNNINAYLTHLGIDMGMDENVQYIITVNGGQVNLSQDNSTINATQNNNGLDLAKLQVLIDSIMLSVKTNAVSTDQMNQIEETLSAIKEEMSKSMPKKSVVTMLLNGLKGTAALLGTIPDVSQKINDFAVYLAQFIS